jgi:hypothetical protein
MIYMLLLMAVVSVIVFWLRLHRAKVKPFSRITAVCDSSKYHCIAITHGKNPCEAVKRLEGQRFLSTEAPTLQLHGCTADSCQCCYIHYDDRREEEQRNPYGKYRSTPPAMMEQERRKQAGRRYGDIAELDDFGYLDMAR